MSAHRSLWPREHGAYAQLAAPLVAAIVARPPSLAAVLLCAGAIGAFLANEPLLVLLGHRGRRRLETERGRARARLIGLGSTAVVAGAAGLALGGTPVLAAAAVVAAPAIALFVFAYRRAQHSVGGELLAAVALPGLAAPVAVASGAPLGAALLVSAAWALGFAASVVAVHRVIARHRRPATAVDHALGAALVAATVAAVLLVLLRTTRLPLVTLPLLVAATLVVLHPPRATRLRAIGVGLVIAAAVSVSLAVAAG